MKRALPILVTFVALLAGWLYWLLPEAPCTLAAPPPPEITASRVADPSAVKLSYVELAASPHRSEQPGATQVYGWLVREDDGQAVNGGTIRLRFFDCSSSAESAAEAHKQMHSGSFRDIRVQEDGGWYADLPGKCWLASVDFTPASDARELTNSIAFAYEAEQAQGVQLFSGPIDNPSRATLIHMSVSLEAPLERGALEISFRASSGIEASGLVFDSQTAEPIGGAHIFLRSMRDGALDGGTDARGAFRIAGIDPEQLLPVNGMLRFLVGASGYNAVEREVAWEPGQKALPAFKVVLEPHAR